MQFFSKIKYYFLGISGPSSRITPERDKELSIPVRAAAAE
jgi:hypothetical protein